MSYNPNIPLVTDPLTQSEFQIKDNFQSINEVFADNHVGLTQDASVRGMHNLLTLRDQDDNPTTTANQVALYNKLVSTIPSLFFMPNSTQTPIQLNYKSISTGLQSTNPDVYKNSQYSFVAGPFIIYGGRIANPTNGQVVTLTPGATLLFADLTVYNFLGSGLDVGMAAPTDLNSPANSFTIRYSTAITSPGQINVFYFAIGI